MALDRRDRAGARTPADLAKKYGLEDINKTLNKIKAVSKFIPYKSGSGDCLYRIVDGKKEWLNPPMGEEYVWYRTMERFLGAPVYTGIVAAIGDDVDVGNIPRGYAILRKSQVVDHYFGRFAQVWITRNGEDNIPDL